jgi:DNA-3-methyladenine glycosylase I
MGELAVVIGADGLARCPWVGETPDYLAYHDDEWGRPVHGDDALFERLCLEAFQSGLSWLTILRKRPAFRAAFADFSIERVAAFDEQDVERLLADAGIVRNRLKINAAIANARTAGTLDGGLSELIWSYAPAEPAPPPGPDGHIPAVTAESTALAKALKKAGFVFVGPTTCYALMQACGLVDDHVADCHVRLALGWS